MAKTIKVESDDPARKKFTVTVKGPVTKVVDINPPSVYMEGKPGDTLEKIVSVTPAPGYPFSILEVNKVNNSPIQVEFMNQGSGEKTSRIKIKAVSQAAKSYYDVVQIKTDSKLRPLLTIRVYAVFIAAPQSQPEYLKSLKIK